jgi:hypothetical protein
MHHPDNLYRAKYSHNADYESFLNEDDLQEFEFEREFDQFLDMTDLDEPDDFFWDEN